MNRLSNINIENARLFFKNFRGLEDKFNRKGDRNFCVRIDPKLAEDLQIDGWNIKVIPPKDEYEEPLYYLKVSVSYNNIPPSIYFIDGRRKIAIDEDGVGAIDTLDISNIDLVISPYHWEVNGKSGVKAYLKTMYVCLNRDAFADKYDFPAEDGEMPY